MRKRAAGILQIGAGAKGLVAGPGQNDRAHIRILMRRAVAARDAGDDLGIEGVALLRPVEGDPERGAALFDEDAWGVVGHDCFLLSLRAQAKQSSEPRKNWIASSRCSSQ